MDNTPLNYETIDINNLPIVTSTDNPACFNVKNCVQQMYLAHNHIIQCKNDTIGSCRNINGWPNSDSFDFDETRSVNLPNANDSTRQSFCGIAWQCNENDPKINCLNCLNNHPHAGGPIVYKCCENEWPFYIAYSCYQGYIPRFWNTQLINEILH